MTTSDSRAVRIAEKIDALYWIQQMLLEEFLLTIELNWDNAEVGFNPGQQQIYQWNIRPALSEYMDYMAWGWPWDGDPMWYEETVFWSYDEDVIWRAFSDTLWAPMDQLYEIWENALAIQWMIEILEFFL